MKSPRTTILGISNAVAALVIVGLFVFGYINEAQMTGLILASSTAITTLVGIFTKDEEYTKPVVDLNDPELVEFLQKQAVRLKKFKAVYEKDRATGDKDN